jgi:hypothetical protein
MEGSDETDIKALTRTESGATFLEEALSRDTPNTIKVQSQFGTSSFWIIWETQLCVMFLRDAIVASNGPIKMLRKQTSQTLFTEINHSEIY